MNISSGKALMKVRMASSAENRLVSAERGEGEGELVPAAAAARDVFGVRGVDGGSEVAVGPCRIAWGGQRTQQHVHGPPVIAWQTGFQAFGDPGDALLQLEVGEAVHNLCLERGRVWNVRWLRLSSAAIGATLLRLLAGP